MKPLGGIFSCEVLKSFEWLDHRQNFESNIDFIKSLSKSTVEKVSMKFPKGEKFAQLGTELRQIYQRAGKTLNLQYNY